MSPSDSGTLADALVEARDRVVVAEAAFRALVREALDAGASTRDVAALLGMSHSTLWRWAGGKPRRRIAVLEQPRRRSLAFDDCRTP